VAWYSSLEGKGMILSVVFSSAGMIGASLLFCCC
jgi:hypothetical protein